MSFSEELFKKKNNLKPVKTVVTDVLGQKFIEKVNKCGTIVTTKLPDKCSGFVIDFVPDLEVCQILEYLYLGSQDPVQESNLLQKHGINHVLTIGVDLPESAYHPNIVYKKIELLDVPDESLTEALKISIDFIESVQQKNVNNKIFVHCNAGYSRAPAIVIGYLMKKYNYSLNKAFKFISEKRKIKPNDGFMKQLEKFEKYI